MDSSTQLSAALSGRYDVEREVGAGGMATVYLARDVRHNRKVALKVLRPDLGAVLGVERFLSEIQVTANLQHPNLLPLFDSGEAGGLLFYVMPFVEGESLRARLQREKQLPVDEAIHLATAVAAALDYAHRHGVIHRDLKPENILLQDGQPLVADFGIALAVSNAGGGRITQTGLSLGTPQYMSPEQATGDRVIDARTDIYSLGAVTYELLTGEPPHVGSSSQAVIARVLTERPRTIRSTRPNVPEHVEAAVDRALEKLPADRFATVHEFADALAGKLMLTRTAASTAGHAAPAAPIHSSRVRRALPWAVALLALGGGSATTWIAANRDEPRTTVRFLMALEPSERWVDATGSPFAISPDGKLVAYVGSRGSNAVRLYLRPLGDMRARELTGTEGASQPFFSPDGAWVGFYDGFRLKKVPVDGGTAVPLAEVPSMLGASWGAPNEIVVSMQNRLAVIPATGGAPRQVAPLDTLTRETSQRWPLALADGRTVLYMSWSSSGLTGGRIAVASLEKGTTRVLDLVGAQPLAVLGEYLVYTSASSAIMAVAFDTRALDRAGSPVPLIDGVFVGGGGPLKGKVSPSGSVVYVGGSATSQVALVGDGAARIIIPEERQYSFPRLSPDGRRIALTVDASGGADIWIHEFASGTFQKLTSDGKGNQRPEWTTDGRSVLYRSDHDGSSALWQQPADASSAAMLLQRADSVSMSVWEGTISPDGRVLLMRVDGGGYTQDIVYRNLRGDTAVKPLIVGPFTEYGPRFSPDGRWVAYSSNQSGAMQVYVTPFPGPRARYQVSTDGGATPVWADGRRLVYYSGQQLIEATLTFAPAFAVTSRRVVHDGSFATNPTHAMFDVTRDGRQYLVLRSSSDNSRIVVVHDWKYELRARMSAGR